MIEDRIERDIVIEAPVDVVWQTVTQPEHIKSWFTNDAELDLRPGGSGVFTWGERAAREDKEPGQTFIARLQVEAVEPTNRFAFRWGHPDGEVATVENSLLVEFALAAEGEQTRLRMVESGIRGLAWSDEAKQAYYDDHNHGWDKHIPDLRDYAMKQAVSA